MDKYRNPTDDRSLLDEADLQGMERNTDEMPMAGRDDAEPERQGDILGLGGSPVPQSPGDSMTGHDPSASVRRRRGMNDEVTENAGVTRGSGATGIDMGSGGNGTDIE